MKFHHSFIFIFSVSIIFLSCFSMKNQLTIAVKNSYFVGHCINNNFIIANPHYCYVLDKSNKQLNALYVNDQPKMHFINIHPLKGIVAIADEQYLQIYDIITRHKIWQKRILPEEFRWYCAPCFNTQHNTILVANNLHQGIDSFNYNAPATPVKVYHTTKIDAAQKIYFHPTEQEYMVVRKDGCNLTKLTSSDKSKEYLYSSDSIIDCSYNHDGSLIAINYKFNGFDILLKNDHHIIQKIGIRDNVRSLKFHPTSFILATLILGNPNNITFWDSKTLNKIATLELKRSVDTTYENNQFKQLLDFSYDSKEIIVALTNECLVLPIPLHFLHSQHKKNELS